MILWPIIISNYNLVFIANSAKMNCQVPQHAVFVLKNYIEAVFSLSLSISISISISLYLYLYLSLYLSISLSLSLSLYLSLSLSLSNLSSSNYGNISFDISQFLVNCVIQINEDKKLIRLRKIGERTLRRTLPLRTLKRTQSLKPINSTPSLMTLRGTTVRNLSLRTLNRILSTEDQ